MEIDGLEMARNELEIMMHDGGESEPERAVSWGPFSKQKKPVLFNFEKNETNNDNK